MTMLIQSKQEIEQRLQEVQIRAQEADKRSHEVKHIAQKTERRLQELEETSRGRARDAKNMLSEVIEQCGTRINEVETRAREAEDSAREFERRAREAENRAREAEDSTRTYERRAQEVERRAREVENRAWEAEGRAREAERRLEQLQQERELERRPSGSREVVRGGGEGKREWLVERKEIHMTGQRLGGGGWGEVMVAEFRGSQVAAKVLYRQLQSSYHHNIFQREMDMAAKVRHPNLVQFLGASMDQEMVILMELMSTSLRQHVIMNTPNLQFSTAVSLDVAKALNYLHLMQPEAILHRDISSANVLLAPLPGYRWRAKVTDYGTVNLQDRLNTVSPGNPVYSAPEAHVPAFQSPKMDIFSFGVVILETVIGQFPEIRNREAMIGAIKEQQWVDLVRQCIHHDKELRPSAAHIITLISSWPKR